VTTFEAGVLMEALGAALLALLLGTGAAGADDAAAPARVDTVVRAPVDAGAPVPPDAASAWLARDAWLGEDKARHFGVSYALVMTGAAGARVVGLDRDAALVAAVAGAAAAGLAKEVFDARRGGPFSLRDLVADAAGIAAAVLVVRAAR
jgi:uncharacterized protein YfiM (DUF2279 family)